MSWQILWLVPAALAALLFLGEAAGLPRDSRAPQDSKPAPSRPADDGAAREALARRLVAANGASEMGSVLVGRMIEHFSESGLPLPAGFAERFRAMAEADDLTERLVPLYIEHYDVETLAAAAAFFESPAGQRLKAKHYEITDESIALGQQWAAEIAQRALAAGQSSGGR